MALATYQCLEVAHEVVVTISKPHEPNIVPIVEFSDKGHMRPEVGQFLHCHNVRGVHKVLPSVGVIGSYWLT